MIQRIALISLGVFLAMGALIASFKLDKAQNSLHKAEAAAVLNTREGDKQAEIFFKDALEQDLANGYRWSDLAEAMQLNGKTDSARYCFKRALELSPGIPQIWVRDANFHFGIGESAQALQSSVHAFKIVDAYDAILFGYFDALIPDVHEILDQIGDDRRVSRAFFDHSLATGNIRNSEIVWQHLKSRNFSDEKLGVEYVNFLMRRGLLDAARNSWIELVQDRLAGYPASNLIFNGDFESDPSGATLDWQVDVSAKFETIRDSSVAKTGNSSLRIKFLGTENVLYRNCHQEVFLQHAGAYRLSGWIRTSGITTNEGIRFEISNPNGSAFISESFGGTRDWVFVNQQFSISSPGVFQIGFLRRPSSKFDNKITGTAWIDGLVLKNL